MITHNKPEPKGPCSICGDMIQPEWDRFDGWHFNTVGPILGIIIDDVFKPLSEKDTTICHRACFDAKMRKAALTEGMGQS